LAQSRRHLLLRIITGTIIIIIATIIPITITAITITAITITAITITAITITAITAIGTSVSDSHSRSLRVHQLQAAKEVRLVKRRI
jgi:hypothetical protein